MSILEADFVQIGRTTRSIRRGSLLQEQHIVQEDLIATTILLAHAGHEAKQTLLNDWKA